MRVCQIQSEGAWWLRASLRTARSSRSSCGALALTCLGITLLLPLRNSSTSYCSPFEECSTSKCNIFSYIYAMLHHPQYREHYTENLKRDLPRIPMLRTKEAFLTCIRIGKQLMDIHLRYEQSKEYPLKWVENREVPFSWRVEKMRLTPDKSAVIINESLTLSGIPQECFQYQLGNRSALDWVINQYEVSEDKRSGIVSNPNNLDDEEYIVRLVGKVIMVSVETVRLVNELAQAVKMEDWMIETTEEDEDTISNVV